MEHFTLYQGSLDIPKIYSQWYEFAKDKNCGALLTFCGIVREEGGIEALSFDIYEPLLKKWFDEWQKRVDFDGISLLFAHSIGDVAVHESSYFAGILSKQRKLGLNFLMNLLKILKQVHPFGSMM